LDAIKAAGGQVVGVSTDAAATSASLAAAFINPAIGLGTLAAQLLIYPVLDFDLDTASYRDHATGYGLTRESMRWYWEQYLGERASGVSAEAAPLRATDHSRLPPALVITCELDPLLDEGVAYARKLAAAGVPVEHLTEPGMIHGYFRMAGVIARARKSWDDCGRFLRRELRS